MRSAFILGGLSLLLGAGCGARQGGAEETPPVDPITEVRGEQLFEAGMGLARMGDYIRAEQYFQAAMARGTPEERVVPMLIRVCLSSSRLRAALGHARPFLDAHPDAWQLRFLVASIHIGLDEDERARDELLQVVEAAPDQAEPRYLLALVLGDRLGQPEAAAVHFRRYLDLAPDGEHAAEVRGALAAAETTVPVAAEPAGPVLPGATP